VYRITGLDVDGWKRIGMTALAPGNVMIDIFCMDAAATELGARNRKIANSVAITALEWSQAIVAPAVA
jgi:hypothetical protein